MGKIEEVNERGFAVFQEALPPEELYQIGYWKETYDAPMRGHDVDGRYYDRFHQSVEWANYWTMSLHDHVEVRKITPYVTRIAEIFLDDPVFYHCDVSVLTPKCQIIRPHVDTPHRHQPWNDKIDRRLSIQFAAPLHTVHKHAGITALLPGSHKQVWKIKKCYGGGYDEEFLKGAYQPDVKFGDLLAWDARTLHSQMPNVSDTNRYMLLFNYVERDILDNLMAHENTLV